MGISERLLRKWRRESLREDEIGEDFGKGNQIDGLSKPLSSSKNMKFYMLELHHRILRLTQELMDQHLLEKGGK